MVPRLRFRLGPDDELMATLEFPGVATARLGHEVHHYGVRSDRRLDRMKVADARTATTMDVDAPADPWTAQDREDQELGQSLVRGGYISTGAPGA